MSLHTPNSVLSRIQFPHQLSLSGNADPEAIFMQARNIQQYHYGHTNTVVSFDPVSRSLIFFIYPGYQDANGVWRPVHVNGLATLHNSTSTFVFPSCWCPEAFAGEYRETVLFTMGPAANAEHGNPGKLALHCSTAHPSLGIFGCKFFVPLEELTSNGALGNTLAAFNPTTMVTQPTIVASTSSNQNGSSVKSTPSPILSSSSSSLLHALDEIVWSSGTSKWKHELESNDGSPEKSCRQAKPLTETDIEDFSPPHWGVLSSKKAVSQDVMFKESFLREISLRGTSTMEEFFWGASALPVETIRALQGRYTLGEGITLAEYRQTTVHCLECGKVFSKLAHGKHACFALPKSIVSRKTAKKGSIKKEKGKSTNQASYIPDVFTSTLLTTDTIIISDSD
ncbi:uncharacterized protein ARMOST_14026 [Armillaria ostoyae]|uniref:Uncharacterized protein n=1 Tax=Armillaria ostoyae TaxID=47428 RepID=A0A284RPK0_ARMOS|nr:uncharacterized protein ARMOST_14026 [Armillaria ostoyae]